MSQSIDRFKLIYSVSLATVHRTILTQTQYSKEYGPISRKKYQRLRAERDHRVICYEVRTDETLLATPNTRPWFLVYGRNHENDLLTMDYRVLTNGDRKWWWVTEDWTTRAGLRRDMKASLTPSDKTVIIKAIKEMAASVSS